MGNCNVLDKKEECEESSIFYINHNSAIYTELWDFRYSWKGRIWESDQSKTQKKQLIICNESDVKSKVYYCI